MFSFSDKRLSPKKLFSLFVIKKEQEHLNDIMHVIRDGIPYRGTNLWVLIFAIFIASIGLNINSTAVIIGAMLISPLMGPIIGIGVSAAINDSSLFRQSVRNFLFSISIGLITSTVYFLLSPLSEAHSELLARTSPTVYDVLIALFGGLAGIIALSSQKKGNVIPGVAIATALMPPLCTAGYGIATGRGDFVLGALYLFFINSVFIALATYIVARLLHFPYKSFPDETERRRSSFIIITAVIVTLVPSVYFGYDMISQNNFTNAANAFIDNEAQFPGDYLLKKTIDARNKQISLVYGGAPITSEQIESVKKRLTFYGIDKATLDIKQGFASLYEAPKNEPQSNTNQVKIDELTAALAERESELSNIKALKDMQNKNTAEILSEMQVLSPKVQSLAIENGTSFSTGNGNDISLALIGVSSELTPEELTTYSEWLRKRTNQSELEVLTHEVVNTLSGSTLSGSEVAP